MLSLIDRMKVDARLLSVRYFQLEADAYHTHGRIALDEGTEQIARRAVAHFETQLEVFKAIGDAGSVATAKANIAYAKSKYEGGNNNEELLKTSQESYELRVAKYGEGSELAIDAGRIYAVHLHNANCEEEAREPLTNEQASPWSSPQNHQEGRIRAQKMMYQYNTNAH